MRDYNIQRAQKRDFEKHGDQLGVEIGQLADGIVGAVRNATQLRTEAAERDTDAKDARGRRENIIAEQ